MNTVLGKEDVCFLLEDEFIALDCLTLSFLLLSDDYNAKTNRKTITSKHNKKWIYLEEITLLYSFIISSELAASCHWA